jgi:RNA polymerase sigma-70 factor (ECF subfamily)
VEASSRSETGAAVRESQATSFEAVALPHVDAAYALARRILRDDHDAQDAVQEAYLRAYRHFQAFRGGDARAWLLAIVRNAALTHLRRLGRQRALEPLERAEPLASPEDDPEVALIRAAGREHVRRAVDQLAPEFREVILLREMEGLSYREMAERIGVPQGTIMSRLARAREQLRRALGRVRAEGGMP